MVELKFITMGDGAQCAMISGISTMLMWCVVSLASAALSLLPIVQHMVRDLILPGWTKSDAKEERLPCLTVHTLAGESKTVLIARMQA